MDCDAIISSSAKGEQQNKNLGLIQVLYNGFIQMNSQETAKFHEDDRGVFPANI